MKRITVFLLIAFLIAGAVSAQGIREPQGGNDLMNNTERSNRQNMQNHCQERNNRQERTDRREMTEHQRENTAVTVEGTVKLEKGFVSIQSGEAVYFVPMLSRYADSIDGLKDGAKVLIEGHGFKNFIRPAKVTIGGKTYIFLEPPRNQGMVYGNHFNQRWDNPRQGMGRKHMRNFNHGRKNMPEKKN